jgi:hypothetical protein
MERPTGVTILAYLYFVVALSALFTLVPGSGQTFNALLENRRLLALSVGFLIICVTLGIGLLRMKNWGRRLAIVLNVANLLVVPYVVVVRHSSDAKIQAGLGALFFVWVIWYLTRPDIKTAFQSA